MGIYSNAWLAYANAYGINYESAILCGYYSNLALDAAKTGVAPSRRHRVLTSLPVVIFKPNSNKKEKKEFTSNYKNSFFASNEYKEINPTSIATTVPSSSTAALSSSTSPTPRLSILDRLWSMVDSYLHRCNDDTPPSRVDVTTKQLVIDQDMVVDMTGSGMGEHVRHWRNMLRDYKHDMKRAYGSGGYELDATGGESGGGGSKNTRCDMVTLKYQKEFVRYCQQQVDQILMYRSNILQHNPELKPLFGSEDDLVIDVRKKNAFVIYSLTYKHALKENHNIPVTAYSTDNIENNSLNKALPQVPRYSFQFCWDVCPSELHYLKRSGINKRLGDNILNQLPRTELSYVK